MKAVGKWGFPDGSAVKNFSASAGDTGDLGLIPGLGSNLLPWRREWQPIPVFLPGETHGQRSLAGYSPQGCKKSETSEPLTLSLLQIQLLKTKNLSII